MDRRFSMDKIFTSLLERPEATAIRIKESILEKMKRFPASNTSEITTDFILYLLFSLLRQITAFEILKISEAKIVGSHFFRYNYIGNKII